MGAIPLSRGWGLRFAGNRIHTGLLLRLNGGLDDFERVPQSIDGSLSLNGKIGRSGAIKIFGFASEDAISADIETPTHDGIYRGTGRTLLGNLTFSHLMGDRFLLKGSFSGTRYSQSSNLGILALEINDLSEKARLDAALDLVGHMTLNTGLEIEGHLSDVDGIVPDDENDFSVGADSLLFATRYRSLRVGYYVELDTRFTRRLLVNAGIRADHESNSRDYCIDPRISTVFKMTENGSVRLAWGIYHQFPAPQYHDSLSGNPGLGAMNSMHIVAGYDYEKSHLRVRAEAYYKRYRDLLLHHETLNYTNDGRGYAQGLDVFAKGSLGLAEGRIAYTCLQARRVEFEKARLAPADFDVTHTVNLVLNLLLPRGFEVSTAFRYATGKPFTPAPLSYNSERLPSYKKWDVALTKLHGLLGGNFAVFFISVSNVMNTANIRDYFFSPDYSERTEVRSYFTRSIYFGVAITLS
jgi:vitamin B12 transporter